jgi:hypothetical protein
MPDAPIEDNASVQTNGQEMKRGSLPPDIVEAIAIANAKSIGEQPAILANLALANQIFNTNLAQQNAIASQQALFQVTLAATAKCADMILAIDPKDPQAIENLKAFIKEFYEMITSKADDDLRANQELVSQRIEALRNGPDK